MHHFHLLYIHEGKLLLLLLKISFAEDIWENVVSSSNKCLSCLENVIFGEKSSRDFLYLLDIFFISKRKKN